MNRPISPHHNLRRIRIAVGVPRGPSIFMDLVTHYLAQEPFTDFCILPHSTLFYYPRWTEDLHPF
ncbi:hypothetical protein QVD99_003358 [Batrachochytrium dendrobatidis]|nr:hypothetical protein QVD99_003358 [Batrachochytrium dendrobatidis]